MSPFGLTFSQMILHTETSKLMYNWSFLFVVLHKPTAQHSYPVPLTRKRSPLILQSLYTLGARVEVNLNSTTHNKNRVFVPRNPKQSCPHPTPSHSVVSYTISILLLLQTPPPPLPCATKMHWPDIFDFRARIRNSGKICCAPPPQKKKGGGGKEMVPYAYGGCSSASPWAVKNTITKYNICT